jgi:hypothetical protein
MILKSLSVFGVARLSAKRISCENLMAMKEMDPMRQLSLHEEP